MFLRKFVVSTLEGIMPFSEWCIPGISVSSERLSAIKTIRTISSGEIYPPLLTQTADIGSFRSYVATGQPFIRDLPHVITRDAVLVDSPCMPLSSDIAYIKAAAPISCYSDLVASGLYVDTDQILFEDVSGHFVCQTFHENYGHFLTQVLPWLHLLRHSHEPLLIPEIIHGYQHELLSLFGLDSSRYLQLPMRGKPSHSYRLTEGAICSVISNHTGYLYLQTLLESSIDRPSIISSRLGSPRRIFLGRSRKKRLENEYELNKILAAAGFAYVDVLSTPVSEVINLAFNADCIAVEPGSGINNVIFARRGIDVIYFYPAHLGVDHSWLSSAAATVSWLCSNYRTHFVMPKDSTLNIGGAFSTRLEYDVCSLKAILDSL